MKYSVNKNKNMVGFDREGYKFGNYCKMSFNFKGEEYTDVLTRIENAYPDTIEEGSRRGKLDIAFETPGSNTGFLNKRILIDHNSITKIFACDVDGNSKPSLLYSENSDDIEDVINNDPEDEFEFDNDAIERILKAQQERNKKNHENLDLSEMLPYDDGEYSIKNNDIKYMEDNLNKINFDNLETLIPNNTPINENIEPKKEEQKEEIDESKTKWPLSEEDDIMKYFSQLNFDYLDEEDEEDENCVALARVLKFNKKKYYMNSLISVVYENDDLKEETLAGRLFDLDIDNNEIILDISRLYKMMTKNIPIESIKSITLLR